MTSTMRDDYPDEPERPVTTLPLADLGGPKAVTWPDGVTKMVHQGTSIRINNEHIEIDNADGHYNECAARQLAVLLLAAADKVEGRG